MKGLPLSKIQGLAWRKNNKVIENPIRPMLQDLNSLPPPAWELVNPQNLSCTWRGNSERNRSCSRSAFPSHFSRGCMASCTFCSSWMIWKGYRWRNGKLVADEIESLINRFGAKHFVFQDDTLTGSRDDIILFAKKLLSGN